ncbi:MAG: hypothetical protein VYB05_12015 [Pseudomonadota bacterium]|nr:hypothetical protein [Pseudomonadota bacterium]
MTDQDQNNRNPAAGRSPARLFPPRMSRSQPQLATSYAPGAMFTWEGGKGACMAVPVEGATIDFSARQTRRAQIIENLEEACESWLARGMNITRDARVYEVQLLDTCFYNTVRNNVEISLDRFEFMRPDKVGYLPGPLVYRCDLCERVREYVSSAQQFAEPLPTSCPSGEGQECRWRQLDVVYIHWSGELEGLSPYRNTMGGDGTIRKIPRCQCGASDFRLIKRGNQFNLWRFKCTGCQAEREVYQTDTFSMSLLKPRIEAGDPHQWSEINMIPISYRASPVFYVQSARFIVYDNDPEVVSLMQSTRANDLVAKLASLHGYGGSDPSDERIRAQLEEKGRGALWPPYEALQRQVETRRSAGQDTGAFEDAARMMRESWYASGDLAIEPVATPELEEQVRNRHRLDYAKRFDPMRSTVEHDALRRRKVNIASEASNLRLPHAELCAEYGIPELEIAYTQRIDHDLARAGIQDAYLIRNLDMVEFSFGFTRVSSTPTTVQKTVRMPVRLKGFPELQNGRRPIYVIEQQNEAIYIQLDPAAVGTFLIANGVLDALPVAPKTLGSQVIEQYTDFGLFMQGFAARDEASRDRTRDVPSLVYMLLHTMAHQVMHGIARFSGLDLGSMSEAIFPADLAFLVHRRGMTEDLGNISSMWRDHNGAFLDFLVARRELRCGSGTLCDHRGGACPACVMVPETSCIAGNQLLSRAVLAGGRSPLWDMNTTPLRGYYQIVSDLRAAQPTNAQ